MIEHREFKTPPSETLVPVCDDLATAVHEGVSRVSPCAPLHREQAPFAWELSSLCSSSAQKPYDNLFIERKKSFSKDIFEDPTDLKLLIYGLCL